MWVIVEWQYGPTEMWREDSTEVGFADKLKAAVRRHGGRVVAIVRLK